MFKTNIFKNDKKESEKHPDFKGKIEIDGSNYWVSMYENTSQKTGDRYYTLYLKQAIPQQKEANKDPF